MAVNEKKSNEECGGDFEITITSVESILAVTMQLFEDFQKLFFYAKQEQEKVRIEVRELLAKSISLRRKDFDHIMHAVFSEEEKNEIEIKELIKNSFMEQKELAIFLGKNLQQLAKFFVTGEIDQIKKVQGELKERLSQQDKRKDILIFKMDEFKKAQQEITAKLKSFLICGNLPKENLRLMIQALKIGREEKDFKLNLIGIQEVEKRRELKCGFQKI